MSENPLVWVGSMMDPSGYGEASRGYILDLCRYMPVKICPRYFWTGDAIRFSDHVWNQFKKMHAAPVDYDKPYTCIQHLTPDNWVIQPGKCTQHIGITTFETDSIPSGWQTQMRSMDLLITHSVWGMEVFRDAGIRTPIAVVPHGVDFQVFNPETEPLTELAACTRSSFVFGSNFDWTERKNPRALIKAYYSEFKDTDDVALVLKTFHQYGNDGSGLIRKEIAAIKSGLGLTKTPPIYILDQIMTQDEMASFYTALDAYVLPARGEGWGMSFTEAMSSGLPTIGVNWSANTEYMDDHNSLLVKNYKLVEITPEAAGAQTQYIGHRWADCDVQELSAHMRELYTNQALCERLGTKARYDMVQKWTWSDAGCILRSYPL